MGYSPAKIAEIVNGKIHGFGDIAIRILLTDSRRVVFAASTAFFALRTSKNDGHKYIPQLAEKGVRCFVVNSIPKQSHLDNSLIFIVVENTSDALQKLASFHRSRFSIPVIGITGSNGKTIIKEWLAQMLSIKYSVVRSPRSYNSQTGVPLSVWQMDETHQMAVFEAGISRPGEMQKLAEIIQPDIGIFTNIGPAHDEGFTNREQKILEKLTLFEKSKSLIYRCDNIMLADIIKKWKRSVPAISLHKWGATAEADIKVAYTRKTPTESFVTIEHNSISQSFVIPFGDDASFENVVHCIVLLILQGFDSETIREGIALLQPVAMRMELKQAINNCSIINDTYNSDVYSLGIALDFLNSQVQYKNKALILSDILQSGIPPEKLYSEVASLIKEKKISHLIGIGTEISTHRKLFTGEKSEFFESTEEYLANYNFGTFRDQAILLKGARRFGFERISAMLQLKDHQTVLEINLDALVHNLNVYRSKLKPGVKIAAMVKAFAYGSGGAEIASTLQYHQVDYLAVAFADEGSELRNAGITLPIMVLNPELYNLDVLFRFNLEPEIYSLSLLRRIAVELVRFGGFSPDNPFPVHIQLDTRMHRLGFMPDETEDLIALLKENPLIKVISVFSHFAASDLPQFDDFTRQQIEMFSSLCATIESGLGYPFLKHIANTTAISRFPDSHFDMVRPGIGLYGVDGYIETEKLLQNVTTFRSVISQIKSVKKGETVGYNRAGVLMRDTTLAIVPAGYADGINRRLGNGNGYLVVNGMKAPFIGHISMDMCAIDITDIVAKEGDEVIIFGKELPVAEVSRQLGTIPYEVFTSVPPRVKRVYFKE